MKRAVLTLMALAAAGLCSGCKLGHGLHRGLHAQHGHCQDGCCQDGCPDGACHGAAHGQCPDGLCLHGCEPGDGHPHHFEPFFRGHQGPPERSGLLGWLGSLGNGAGGPAGAQPAPGPSAGNVSYPYYTTRGPRDFLARNPRSIGP